MTRTCLICLRRGLRKDQTVERRSTTSKKWYVLCKSCDKTLEDAEIREIQQGFQKRGY
jgi:hypothetical protein